MTPGPTRFALLATALVAPALGLMLAGLAEPLHGEHIFRQTHVAGNVEKFLAHGLSLRPETYNQDTPGALFDFPLYPWLVAALCRGLGSQPVATARATNVAVFALVLLALESCWRAAGARRAQRLFGLGFFAYAPLVLFYFQVPLPDPLALLLALVSVRAYLRWDEAAGAPGRRAALLVFLSSACLATLVKNPLYLPYALGLCWHRLRRRGPGALLAPGFLAFLLVLAAAVVGFKLYSNHVNHVAGFLGASESEAFFGTWHERLRPKYWKALAEAFGTRVAPPVSLACCALGIAAYAARARSSWRSLHLGLLGGCLVTLLLFFPRHHEHAYYQIPFVPVLAFFAACGPGLCASGLRLARRRRRIPALAAAGLGLLLLAAVAWAGLSTCRRMSEDWDASTADRGAFVAAHSQPDDFVVYVLGWREDNWEPSHLYFARRDGYNLARPHVTYARLAELQRRFAPRYDAFLVFAPSFVLADVDERLQRLGARVAADDPNLGRLYRLDPDWLKPLD